MRSLDSNPLPRALSSSLQLRHAVLLTFCDHLPEECMRLTHLSSREWLALLHWLDTSGLALYFLDRICELQRMDLFPPAVLARLSQNLADNAERVEAMIAESMEIQQSFQDAGISYAVLKGFSLWPVSVPKLELRSQLDHDFLVAEECATEAKILLERCGFKLQAISGKIWEFKAMRGGTNSLKELYKAGRSSSAELHLESVADPACPLLLSRAQVSNIRSLQMPVLPPEDLFLWQGLHLYKHVCGEFLRAAHLIEFRRHVVARFDDDGFWARVHAKLEGDREICLMLGVAILLITRVMSPFAPEALTHWTVGRLPASAVLWIDLYGLRSVLASFPGSKLYLILQRELESVGLPVKRSVTKSLVPLRLPPPIVTAQADESLIAGVMRIRKQLQFIAFRLRFHIVEGMLYICESARWRHRRRGLAL